MKRDHLVCQGAICKCAFGSTPDKLKVLTQNKRFINEKEASTKLLATHQELGQTFEKNSFGSCAKMKNNPCTVTVTQWQEYYEPVVLEDNNGSPLLESSKATCPIGAPGCITIINHGQISEVTPLNLKNAEKEALAELNPLLDMGEIEIFPALKTLPHENTAETSTHL